MPGETQMTLFTRRRSAIVALAAVLSALLASSAVAGKPDRQMVPLDASDVFPPGFACPEAIAPEGVRVTRAGGNAAITFFDNGSVMTTARHPDLVTNIATGKSVIVELQGSGAFVPQPDGSGDLRLSGTTVFTFFPGDVGPGDDTTGRSYLFTGNVQLVFGAAGSVIAFESSGLREDVCAMLA